jgi:hypothetical protein
MEPFYLRENKMLHKQRPNIPYEQPEQNGIEKKNSNYSDTTSSGKD